MYSSEAGGALFACNFPDRYGLIVLPLPPIPNPKRYVGLFVYDFGSHIAVGYTAGEVRILRESAEHGNGQAYQVYRVDDDSRMELVGVGDDQLIAKEAFCFLRQKARDAEQDYRELQRLALSYPLPCAVEMRLARCASFQPPHVTALCYGAPASVVLARWLDEIGFHGGDDVIAGTDVHARLFDDDQTGISSCLLPAPIDYQDRDAEEVLSAVDRAVQR